MSCAACETLVHFAGATASHLMLRPDANSASATTITSRPIQTAHQSSVEKSPRPPGVLRAASLLSFASLRSFFLLFDGWLPAGSVCFVSLIIYSPQSKNDRPHVPSICC